MVASAGDLARRYFDAADKSVTDQYSFAECERMGAFMNRFSEVSACNVFPGNHVYHSN